MIIWYYTFPVITARKRSLRRLCFYRGLSVHRGGHAWLLWGGMHVCSLRACMVAPRGARAWLLQGACMVAPGGCAWLLPGGYVWLLPGGHSWLLWVGDAWLLPGGMRGCSRGDAWLLWGGHAWFFRWDMVNEQVVCILLECILVSCAMTKKVPF